MSTVIERPVTASEVAPAKPATFCPNIAEIVSNQLRRISSIVTLNMVAADSNDHDSQHLNLIELVKPSMRHVARVLEEAESDWNAIGSEVEGFQRIMTLFNEAGALAELFNEVCIVDVTYSGKGPGLKFNEQITANVLDAIETLIDELVALMDDAACTVAKAEAA